MFALYLEKEDGHLEWFCAAPDEQRARVVARFSSKYGDFPVVVMQQQTRIASYENGAPHLNDPAPSD